MNRKSPWMAGAVAVLSALSLSHTALAAEDAARQITVVHKPLASVSAPASDLKVSAWSNRADGLYVPGESVQLFFKVSRDAYITVLNVDAVGNTHVLFPNRFATSNFVRANGVVKLPADGAPYDLQVGAPYGANLIKVVASTTNTGILPAGAMRSVDGLAFSQVTTSVDELSRQIQIVVNQQPQAGWAMAEYPIGVVAQRPAAAAAPTISSGTTITTTGPGSTTVTVTGGAATTTVASAPAFTMPALASDFVLQVVPVKTAYASGESMQVSVTPEKNCRLTLINVDPQGSYQVLYPNRIDENVVLKAGRTTVLPGSDADFGITVTGSGRNHLVAMCSEKKSLLGSLFGTSRAAHVTAKQPSLSEVLSAQGDGRVARVAVGYDVR